MSQAVCLHKIPVPAVRLCAALTHQTKYVFPASSVEVPQSMFDEQQSFAMCELASKWTLAASKSWNKFEFMLKF